MNNFLKRLNNSIKAIIQRLNFFDILTFLALFVVLLILLRNYWQKKVDWVNVRLSVENVDWWYRGSKPDYWYAKNLQQGDIAYDSFGQEVAEVLSVENYDLGEDGRAIYVNMKVRANLDRKRQQYLYEFKPLLVGSSATFNFGQEQLRGLVLGLGDDVTNLETEFKTVKLVKNFVIPELANQVKVGQKILASDGSLLAEVVASSQQPTQYYEFSDIQQKKILVYDPGYRLLKIELRMKTFKAFDEYYFIDNVPLKAGQLIDLNFSNFVVKNVEIMAIE